MICCDIWLVDSTTCYGVTASGDAGKFAVGKCSGLRANEGPGCVSEPKWFVHVPHLCEVHGPRQPQTPRQLAAPLQGRSAALMFQVSGMSHIPPSGHTSGSQALPDVVSPTLLQRKGKWEVEVVCSLDTSFFCIYRTIYRVHICTEGHVQL